MCEYELHIRICFAECKDLNIYFMCNVLLIYKEMWRGESCVDGISLFVGLCQLLCVGVM
jgi:hypothetical protein